MFVDIDNDTQMVEKLKEELEKLLEKMEQAGRLDVAKESLEEAAMRFNAKDTLNALQGMVNGQFGHPNTMFDNDGLFQPAGQTIVDDLNQQAWDLRDKTIPELMAFLEERCGDDPQLWIEALADVSTNEEIEREFNNR